MTSFLDAMEQRASKDTTSSSYITNQYQRTSSNGSHSSQTNTGLDQRDDKIAAAKAKLKKFKKESNKDHVNDQHQSNQNFLRIDTTETGITHESTYTSGRTTPGSVYSSKQTAAAGQRSPYPYQSLTDTSSFNNERDYMKEQLQLHVQTIGILVAEKTELHSKLQQTEKKCDKFEHENDELLGRLKASRQKITDLERHVQYQQDQRLSTDHNSTSSSPVFDMDSQTYIERLKSELNSIQSVNVELKMKLDEASEYGLAKDGELNYLQHKNQELSSQVELVNLKLTQFSNNNMTDRKVDDYLTNVDEKAVNELRVSNKYSFIFNE